MTDELEFDEQLRTLPDLITNEERRMVRETEEPLRDKFLQNFRLITEEWCNKRKINLHLGSFRLCDGPSYYQCRQCGYKMNPMYDTTNIPNKGRCTKCYTMKAGHPLEKAHGQHVRNGRTHGTIYQDDWEVWVAAPFQMPPTKHAMYAEWRRSKTDQSLLEFVGFKPTPRPQPDAPYFEEYNLSESGLSYHQWCEVKQDPTGDFAKLMKRFKD